MSLSIARTTMSILLLLPLLLAHRHPHYSSRPRASILRRMPMFYGKRDPALASPASASPSSAFPESAISVLSGAGSSLSRSVSSSNAVPDRYVDSREHLRQPGRRSGSVERRGRLKARSKQRFVNDESSEDEQQRFVNNVERSEGEAGRRPDFSVPSVLLIKLYDHVGKAGNNDGDDGATANVFGNNGARPQFLDSEAWYQPHQSGADGRVHKKAADSESAANPQERLRRRLQILGTALGYDRDGYKDISQPPEEDGSDLILLEVNDGGDSDGDVNGLYYDDLLDNSLISDGDSADDDGYENSDEAFVIGPLDSGM